MPVTRNFNVAWEEVPPYRENHVDGDFSITRTAKVRWSDVRMFCLAMLGTSFLNGSQLRRFVPEPHPWYPDTLFCQDVQLLDGKGAWTRDTEPASNQLIRFFDNAPNAAAPGDGFAYLSCTYKSPGYRVLDDTTLDGQFNANEIYRYTVPEGTYNVENLGIPGPTFRWVETPTPAVPVQVPGAFPITLPKDEVKVLWHELPYTAYAALLSNINNTRGCINNADFSIPRLGTFAKGTLLYLTAQPRFYTSKMGFWMFDITHKFLSKAPYTWNRLWRASIARFVEITANGLTNETAMTDFFSPYNWRDFTKLFSLS